MGQSKQEIINEIIENKDLKIKEIKKKEKVKLLLSGNYGIGKTFL